MRLRRSAHGGVAGERLRHAPDTGCRCVARPAQAVPARAAASALVSAWNTNWCTRARIAKADFALGRMHVDVDPRRIDLEKQHEGRMPFLMQHVVKRLADGVGDQAVAHEAPVDEEILVVARAAVEGGRGDQSVTAARWPAVLVERQAGGLELFAQQRAGRAVAEGLRRQSPLRAPVVLQRHAPPRAATSAMRLNTSSQCAELGALGPQELATRAGVL